MGADQHLGALAGFAVVLVGLVAKQVAVSVIGFVIIVAACAYAAGMLSRKAQAVGEDAGKARHAGPPTRYPLANGRSAASSLRRILTSSR